MNLPDRESTPGKSGKSGRKDFPSRSHPLGTGIGKVASHQIAGVVEPSRTPATARDRHFRVLRAIPWDEVPDDLRSVDPRATIDVRFTGPRCPMAVEDYEPGQGGEPNVYARTYRRCRARPARGETLCPSHLRLALDGELPEASKYVGPTSPPRQNNEALRTQVEQLLKENAEAKWLVGKWSASHNALIAEIRRLRQENAELKTDNRRLHKQATNLYAENVQLTSREDDLCNENERLDRDNWNLRLDVEAFRDDIEEVRTILDKHSDH